MKKRIFENLKTTIAGAILMAIALAGAWFGKWTFAEASGFIVTAAGLFWVKDSVLKKE